MEELTTEEMLNKLHEDKCKTMESPELFEYLMTCAQYLKTGDLNGWMLEFMPEPVQPPAPVKRLRQSPLTAAVIPLPLCKQCKSDQVIEDVPRGQVVCIACGLIQQLGVFTADFAHCSYDTLKNGNRACIHRYSRVVYFVTVVRLLQGQSSPEITEEELSRLRVALDGNLDIDSMNKQLRKLGLAKRFRRHRWSLLVLLGGECPYYWDGRLVKKMAKMFRVVEFHWGRKRNRLFPGRKVFFSCTTLLYQFLTQLGLSPPTTFLLKSDKLRKRQYDAYQQMCCYTGFKCYK